MTKKHKSYEQFEKKVLNNFFMSKKSLFLGV